MVEKVSFTLDRGVVVLAGPNGAGKTTVLRVLATLLPFTGSVSLAGFDLSTPAGRRRARTQLGFLPQEAAFPDDFSVAEAVAYAAWLQRVPARERTAATSAALSAVGLADRAHEALRQLSTGLRRRAFLAQAIVHRPPVLLLDEPTAGVTEHRAEFRRLVRTLGEDRLVVLTTHLTEEIEFLDDRLLVLGGGRVRFDGTPAELETLAGGGAAADAPSGGCPAPAHRNAGDCVVTPMAASAGQAEQPRTAPDEPAAPGTAVPAVIRLMLRRSVGRPAILAATAVIVANVMLRERDWVHEWQWAWFNYHFVTIFLGPLAAGLGAWEGARLARASDVLDSAGAARRALSAASGAVFAWLLLPYLAGLGWISGMVIAAGTPGGPGIIELSTLGPALAFLGAWVIVGAAAGYRSRSPLSAPLTTVGPAGRHDLVLCNPGALHRQLHPRPRRRRHRLVTRAGPSAGNPARAGGALRGHGGLGAGIANASAKARPSGARSPRVAVSGRAGHRGRSRPVLRSGRRFP